MVREEEKVAERAEEDEREILRKREGGEREKDRFF